MTLLDPKAYLRNTTQTVASFFVKDMTALPEAAFASTEEDGTSRSPLDVAAECAGLNNYVAAVLSGSNERPTDEMRAAYRAHFDSRDTAVSLFQDATEKLLSAIDAVDVETLGTMVAHPFGHQDTLFSVASLPALHIMYHDGQFNYIQRLHGDTEMHWR